MCPYGCYKAYGFEPFWSILSCYWPENGYSLKVRCGHGFYRPRLKIGMDFEGEIWKWTLKNYILHILSDTRSGFGEPPGTPWPKIPRHPRGGGRHSLPMIWTPGTVGKNLPRVAMKWPTFWAVKWIDWDCWHPQLQNACQILFGENPFLPLTGLAPGHPSTCRSIQKIRIPLYTRTHLNHAFYGGCQL